MDQKLESEVSPPREPAAVIKHYHAHIYYDPATTREKAARLREHMAARFPDAVIGSWHDQPVGPHTEAMYQVAFATDLLASFLPWLMLNRDGLTILVHPGTGNGYADHTAHAVWFGAVLPVRLKAFKDTSGEG